MAENQIELYCVDPALGLPSFDPNSMIVQTYLRLARVDFELKMNPYTVPSLIVPGQVPGDSQVPMMKHVVRTEGRKHTQTITGLHPILQYLKDKSVDLDAYIQMRDSELDSSSTTLKEIRAEIVAYTTLIEEKLFPCLMYHWWLHDDNYQVIKPILFRNTPFLMRWFYSSLLRKQCSHYLYRMEIRDKKSAEDRAKECLTALSVLLGNKSYFYGETPSTLDAVVYGYLACFKFPNLPDSTLENLVSQYPNLSTFVTNVSKQLESLVMPTRKLITKTQSPSKNEVKDQVIKSERKTIRRFWSISAITAGLMLAYIFGAAFLRKRDQMNALMMTEVDEYHFDDQFEGLTEEEDVGQYGSNYRH